MGPQPAFKASWRQFSSQQHIRDQSSVWKKKSFAIEWVTKLKLMDDELIDIGWRRLKYCKQIINQMLLFTSGECLFISWRFLLFYIYSLKAKSRGKPETSMRCELCTLLLLVSWSWVICPLCLSHAYLFYHAKHFCLCFL